MGDYIQSDVPTLPKKLQNDSYDIYKDEVFKKYANKTSPLSGKKSRAGLSTYTGTWTKTQVRHLLRRTMYGHKKSEINQLLGMSPAQAVSYLLNNIPVPANPPLNYYQNIYADTSGITLGQPWVNAPFIQDGTLDYYRRVSIRAWWMENIVNTNTSIIEKMIIFMHNFFPVEFRLTGDPRFSYKYLDLLRTHALGNLKTFVTELSKDGAMLFYLNGHYNIKNSPDENYARELQELFTVGKYGTTIYSETDVQEAAKVLTGWRRDNTTLSVNFNSALHETANKQFSSYYGNTLITGQSGAAGANELTDLINMIFTKQQDIAKYFARKLYRFFVYYDIDATVESTIIAGLAQTMINNNWEIKPVIQQLLQSDHFFDPLTMDCYIRTPMDYFLGTFRTFSASVDTSYSLEDKYKTYYKLSELCSITAQTPGDPPAVSGWPAFHQIPYFHEMWINSDTIPKRMYLSESLISTNGMYVSANARLKWDVLKFAESLDNPGNAASLVAESVDLLFGIGLSQTLRDDIKNTTLLNSITDAYWTTLWNAYIANPSNQANANSVRIRLQSLYQRLLLMAEHHLA